MAFQCAPVTRVKILIPADYHLHFRQGENVAAFIEAHLRGGFDVVLAMPNTSPPVAVLEDLSPPGPGAVTSGPGFEWRRGSRPGPTSEDARSLKSYRAELLASGADKFRRLIIPLYLSALTTPEMIEQGAKSGELICAKYYPPHATTGSHGVGPARPMPFEHYMENGVFAAMEKHGIILNIHGEMHGVKGKDWFDRYHSAETKFYATYMPQLVKAFPNLRIVCEHITTKGAARFVQSQRVRKPLWKRAAELFSWWRDPAYVASPQPQQRVVATICPQHLLNCIGDLVQNMAVHALCMPVLKFWEDVVALLEVITDEDNVQFFAGSDSAPHPSVAKQTPCGCAAGCFTGGYVVQLYAEAFELAGCDLSQEANARIFERFMCINGHHFYGTPLPTETITLEKVDEQVVPLSLPSGDKVIPFPMAFHKPADYAQAKVTWRIVA